MNETNDKPTAERQKDWQKTQDQLAERAGLSVLLVDGHQPPALAVSNNNSICRVVQSSPTHAAQCEPFCGAAFERVSKAGEPVNYRCHAGLYCVAAPVKNEEKPLVAIVGRAFLKTSDYRDLTERIFLGDWQNLPETELFENVNLSGSIEDLERLAARLQNLNAEEQTALTSFLKKESELSSDEIAVLPETESDEFLGNREDILELHAPAPDFGEILVLDDDETIEDALGNKVDEQEETTETQRENLNFGNELTGAWRKKSTNSLRKNYLEAAAATLDLIEEKFGLDNLAWLERRGAHFIKLLQNGDDFAGDIERIKLQPDDELLNQAAENGATIWLENKSTGEEIELFPIVSTDGDVCAAIVVADGSVLDERRRERLSNFLREIALPLEILRLREEAGERARLQAAIKKFNSDLQNAEAENFFDSVVENGAALVGAERASLLFFDEGERVLRAVAAAGACAEEIKNEFKELGERIAFTAFQNSQPILVGDVSQLNLPAAERSYKTNSFLILPLKIGGRTIGVLNVTDKSAAEVFDETDLQLLETVAPQIAIALDRARLDQKAGEFETASITDALTGLLNRRYMEVRLDEEIRRSKRHGYPLSFMMIDVDHFKSYNDLYGHQAGDEALRVVATSLKATLRDADIASRYGGEEFSILLPQITQSEARLIGERIRRRIEATLFPHGKVTVSIGIAGYTVKLDSPNAIIKAADEALYAAKNAGRNNVQVYGNGKIS